MRVIELGVQAKENEKKEDDQPAVAGRDAI